MLAAAKTRPTETHTRTIRLKASTPRRLLRILRPYMVGPVDDRVDITTTAWYRGMERRMKPEDYLRELREAHGLTQTALGERLGLPVQRVNDWEHGRRCMSKAVAKRLAELFSVSSAAFI
jgi:DNA-binding transcriptional regulator YiaG